jgi:hypothetical protein
MTKNAVKMRIFLRWVVKSAMESGFSRAADGNATDPVLFLLAASGERATEDGGSGSNRNLRTLVERTKTEKA